jgi:large subunit ribosomal protein L17
MRHLNSGKNLQRTASHRKAMLANMATSIFEKERVKTTIAKAKEVRKVVERLITYAKTGGLHSIRLAARTIKDKTVLKKLFDDIGPSYKERTGGYLRILKMPKNRPGDNAQVVLVELVGRRGEEQRKKPRKKSTRKKNVVSAPVQEQGTVPAVDPVPAPVAADAIAAGDSMAEGSGEPK